MRVRQICVIIGLGLFWGILMGGITDLRAQEKTETTKASPVQEAAESATATPEKTSPPGKEETEAAKKKKAAADKTHALETVVVTATKTPRNPDDVPASITVITAKDIERQNILNADQALGQVPGVAQRRAGFSDTIPQVNLRGFPSYTRTLVLYDGQSLHTGSSKSLRWGALPVEEIERIEVVRGPFSALYGGNAMGGVINVITKTPKKLEMTGSMSYGRYDTWSTYLAVGDRLWDKLSVKVSWTYQDTGGYPKSLVTKTAKTGAAASNVVGWIPTHTTTDSPTYIIGDTGDSTFWNSSLNAKVSWDIAPGHKIDFTMLQNWNQYDYGDYHTYLRNAANGAAVNQGTVGLANTNQRFTGLLENAFLAGPGREYQAVYNLASEHQLTDSTTLKLRGGLVDQPRYEFLSRGTTAATTYYGGPGTVDSNKTQSWSGEVQLVQGIGAKQTLTGGVALNVDTGDTKIYNVSNWRDFDSKMDITYRFAGKTTTWGFYAQDEIVWHPMFSTVVGARLDYWTNFDGMYQQESNAPKTYLPSRSKISFNPKVAFLFRPFSWMSWRASAGTTFRAPTISELYRTWTSSSGTTYKGNPSLEPENAISWEVGTTLKPFKGNVITATFFDNHVSDLIYRGVDSSDPTGNTLTWQNAAKARIMGVEVEVTQKLCSWLNVFGNTTLLDARILKSDINPKLRGKKLTYVPRQQFNFGFNAKYWIFNGNLTGRYVSKLPARDDNSDCYNGVPGSYDPYFTMDAKLIAAPVKWASVSFSVDNMLNRKYFQYYLTPGRTFWIMTTLKY
jgi:iron complex outermembrane receptor protein